MQRKYVGAGVMLLMLAAGPVLAQASAPFDPEAATRAYLGTLKGAARARSDAYFEGGYWLILWDALYAFAVNLLLLASGAAARMEAFAGRVRHSLAGRTFVFGLLYVLATALLSLPLTLWEGFYREHLYGLSNQTLAQFLGETAKSVAIGGVLNALLFVPVLLLIRRTRLWWAWSAGVVVLGATVLIALSPVFIEPLFNKYTPMAESPLRESILSLARANGVPARNVFVVDASRQTKRISANVAGLGATARIALNDNLLATKDPAAIRAVMGHEMGHYVLGHVWKSLLQMFLLIGTLAGIMAAAAPALVRRYGARWGLSGMATPAIIPVFALILTVLSPAAQIVLNQIIRNQEAEADIFGLNAVREPDGFARVAMMLSQYRKIEPSPWEERIFFDHPSGRSRVSMAMRWKAEALRQQGQPVVAPAE